MTDNEYETFQEDDGMGGKNSTWIRYVSRNEQPNYLAAGTYRNQPSADIRNITRELALNKNNSYEANKETYQDRKRRSKLKSYDRIYH